MPIYKLGELGNFKGGISSLDKKRYGEGNIFVNYMDVFNNFYINEKVCKSLRRYLSNNKEYEKYNLKYGDAIFTCSSETPEDIAMSSIYLSEKKAIFNGFSKRYRFNQEILLPKYAAYLFRNKNFREQVKSFSTGYTRYNISQRDLLKVKINIPDKKSQQKIIDIVEPLENLILNINNIFDNFNKIVKNLPILKKVIFSEIIFPIKNRKKNIKQISAKVLFKRGVLPCKIEDRGTYATNTFFTPKNSLLINTIRTYLEKFSIVPVDCDSNGTLAQFKIKDNFATSVISTLLNNDFWNSLSKFKQGTKMPVVSKKDIIKLKARLTPKIEGLLEIYSNIFKMKEKVKEVIDKFTDILIK